MGSWITILEEKIEDLSRLFVFSPTETYKWGNWENLVKLSRLANSLACLVAQSCPTLCNPMDCSTPGSSVHGILQARILERVAISHSRGSSQPRDQTCCLLHLLYWQTGSLPLRHLGSPANPDVALILYSVHVAVRMLEQQ